MTPANQSLHAMSGVPTRSMMGFISILLSALPRRRHRPCVSFFRWADLLHLMPSCFFGLVFCLCILNFTPVFICGGDCLIRGFVVARPHAVAKFPPKVSAIRDYAVTLRPNQCLGGFILFNRGDSCFRGGGGGGLFASTAQQRDAGDSKYAYSFD